jgi:hypothetical protein
MVRQTPIISISINGGDPNVSDDSIPLGGTVVLENTDRINVDGYSWQLVSKPPGSAATLSMISWDRQRDGGALDDIKTSFVADKHGTYIVELTLNRWLKGRVGIAVKSPYLNMRLPVAEEQDEFEGWGTALFNSLMTLEDGYATNAAATGSGVVGGDLSGSLPNPSVVKIQGKSVSSTVPTSGQVLSWNGSAWTPTTVALGGAAGGDLSGTYPNPTVAKVQGRSVDSTAPSPTDVLAWDGVKWTPTAPGAPGAHATSHQLGGADQVSVAGLSGVLADAQNANKLQTRNVSSAAPSSGHVLSWNGSAWAPTAPTGGSHTMGGTQHIADTLASVNTKISDANLIATTTAAGGDLSGTYPDPSVVKLQGRTVDSAAPALSEVLTWDGSKWSPQSGGGPPSGAAGGDLDGTYPNPTVDGIRGYAVENAAPSGGDVLVWSSENTQWEPTAMSGGGVGHFLVFSDDTEFTETGTTSVVKKTFRLVIPSGRANDQWLAVISLWVTGGYGDTAECIVDVGGDTTTFTTTNGTETVIEQPINVTASAGTLLTVEIKLRVTTGTDTAHLKYTDLFAIHN